MDRSHPAFYLPGQEFGAGNHRAFAALDACVQDGNDCLTGIDCCGGFCYIPGSEVRREGKPSGAMTCCGIANLLMAKNILSENPKVVQQLMATYRELRK